MPGARHQLSPAVTIEEAIDRALIDLMSDFGFIGALDLAHSGNLSALGLRKKGARNSFSSEKVTYWCRWPPLPGVSIASTPKRL
jgi:hypothetical protein